MKIIESTQAPEPIGPYSQATEINGLLFVSGQIAIDRENNNELKTGSITEETAQVMKNIGFILNQAGYKYANVVKCSIFIKNMDDFALINSKYGEFFDQNPPARETVEVSQLPKNVNVEISCIAAL
ncbi:MAG: RidA family protein [Cyclobacteriaceae bacterium]